MNLVDLVILQQGNEFAAQGQTASLQEHSSPTLADRARLVWPHSLSDPWLSLCQKVATILRLLLLYKGRAMKAEPR